MPFKYEVFGKTFVEWGVPIPSKKSYNLSPDFHLGQLEWELKLETTWDESSNDERWTMHFRKRCSEKMTWKYQIKSYVRDKEGDHLYMDCKECTASEIVIWSYTQRSFFNAYSNAEFADDKLTFLFLFDLQLLDPKPIHLSITEHKSIQTPSCLDDRLCLENLSLDFRKLMDEGSNTDVQLKCGDCSIPAHRLILSSRSEVFRAMLQSDMVEGREGSVEIVDMDPKGFEIFVQYLYSGILPEMTGDIVSTLYAAGDKYQLEALRRRCRDLLAENLTRKNACEILVMADAHSDKDLKDRVVSYILDEKIPRNDDEWPTFCDNHPKLANEVLNRACKQLDWIAQ